VEALGQYACEMAAPICLIVNPSAGGGKAGRALPQVLLALEGHGLVVRHELTRDLAHARELASSAALGNETVVCLSGDGMVGVVADVLREIPDTLLGVLPGGRGNDLARVLGIPADPVEACAVIAEGFSRELDLGEVTSHAGTPLEAHLEGHTLKGTPHEGGQAPSGTQAGNQAGGPAFVGIASVGFDSEANRIANEAPAWLGGLVYAYGALRALLSWQPARFKIELTGSVSPGTAGRQGTSAVATGNGPVESHRLMAYTVGACNSKTYGGGMRAAPDAILDDGLLDVVVLESIGKLAFVTRILPKVFKGTHVHEPGVKVFRAREVSIEADRPFTMYADGDPIGELPVTVRTVPGAVRMIVPRQGAGADAFLDGQHGADAATARL
jgi:diacylglycerol kinase family enzyme